MPAATSQGAAPALQLLGGFGLVERGRAIGLPSGSRRVLAYVALARQPVPRAYVAGQLWTDSSERGAAGSLRSALWGIRRLGCEALEASDGLLVVAEHVGIDVIDGIEAAQTLIRGEEPDLDDARHGHFTRDLLPDWYEDWVLFERERVRQLFLHALESLAARLAAADRWAEAIDTCLSAIRMEPLRESAWRRLMEIHVGEGNRAEALRQYHTFSGIIRSELGFGPSEDMGRYAGRLRT